MAKSRMKSKLATPAFTKKVRKRRNTLYGICVHTTGRGVLKNAKKENVSPIEWALSYYKRSGGVHYCIDYSGSIYQIIPDNWWGAHVGISPPERKAYLSGEWESKFRKNPGYKLWKKRWPNYDSPQHMYPSTSPNADYIGVELIPLEDATFTEAQYDSLAKLCKDRAVAHRWPTNWYEGPRLVGHEDLDAFERWNSKGGWDPGYLRKDPRFHWEKVLGYIEGPKTVLPPAKEETAFPETEKAFKNWFVNLFLRWFK